MHKNVRKCAGDFNMPPSMLHGPRQVVAAKQITGSMANDSAMLQKWAALQHQPAGK